MMGLAVLIKGDARSFGQVFELLAHACRHSAQKTQFAQPCGIATGSEPP